MLPRSFILFAALGLACDAGGSPGSDSASRSASGSPSAIASASAVRGAQASAAAGVTASLASSAASSVLATASVVAPASPCPEGAKSYPGPRFCIVLPPDAKPKSYEESPDSTVEELYDKDENILRLTWVSGKGPIGTPALKSSLETVSKERELVASGDLPRGGLWAETKLIDGPLKGTHVVDAVFETPKFLINCNYAVPEAKAELGRSVCKSLRVY